MADIFFGKVCPVLGVVIGNAMWLSPMPAVLAARKSHVLGPLNPLPSAVACMNCVGWIIYGCLQRDMFIFFGNFFGLCLGFFYTLTAVSLILIRNATGDDRLLSTVQGVLIGGLALFTFMCMIGSIALDIGSSDSEKASFASAIGGVSCALAMAYYTAPLATAYQVIMTRDSSSLLAPMICINFVNAAMWTMYGVYLLDPIVWGPNSFGLALSGFQLSLVYIYRSPNSKKIDQDALIATGSDANMVLSPFPDPVYAGANTHDSMEDLSALGESNQHKSTALNGVHGIGHLILADDMNPMALQTSI